MLIDDYLLDLKKSIPDDEFIRFMITLGFNLTVSARNTYKTGCDEVESSISLRGINEIQHRILSQVIYLLNKENSLYEPFVYQIIELAEHYNCQLELRSAIEFSVEQLASIG